MFVMDESSVKLFCWRFFKLWWCFWWHMLCKCGIRDVNWLDQYGQSK